MQILLTLILLFLSPVTFTAEGRKTNQLIHESSPCLLQYAYNPVSWYAWGSDAFEIEKKKKADLAISYGSSPVLY